jgi:hypothetical protein
MDGYGESRIEASRSALAIRTTTALIHHDPHIVAAHIHWQHEKQWTEKAHHTCSK